MIKLLVLLSVLFFETDVSTDALVLAETNLIGFVCDIVNFSSGANIYGKYFFCRILFCFGQNVKKSQKLMSYTYVARNFT